MRRAWFQLALCLAAPACSELGRSDHSADFAGVGCYECCFETSIFVPSPPTSSEFWNVESPPEKFLEQFMALRRSHSSPNRSFAVSVRIRGTTELVKSDDPAAPSRLLEILDFSEMEPHPEQGCFVVTSP